jgi:hypothetical protein
MKEVKEFKVGDKVTDETYFPGETGRVSEVNPERTEYSQVTVVGFLPHGMSYSKEGTLGDLAVPQTLTKIKE